MSSTDRYGYKRLKEVATKSVENGDSSIKFRDQNHVNRAEHVYTFASSNSHSSIDDVEMSEIRSRKLPLPKKEELNDECIEHFNREITEDDTLQSLSLQYACSISELKRINNLIRDQDFFGLRVIKIPVKRFGILSELVKEQEKKTPKTKEHLNRYYAEALPNEADSNDSDLNDPETQQLVIRTLSIRDTLSSQTREAEEFLKNMDNDLNKIRSSTRTKHNSLDEVISVLTNRSIRPISPRKASILNGVDCGIRWWSVILVVVLLCILLPVAYFIYVYNKS